MARIFICGDTGQTGLLDRTAKALRADGHVVSRGSPDEGGKLKRYSQQDCDRWIADADLAVFTTRHLCDRSLLTQARHLRGVCFPVTGVETLDLAAASELGIIVGHGAVTENAAGMAEAALMLLLMLFYRIDDHRARLGSGEWRPPNADARQLGGKTIGLIGFGRIARRLAELLTPFGTRILVYSPRTAQDSLPDGAVLVGFDELLQQSHAVVPLTVLTDETRHMIGAEALAQMRADAFLINIGRGELTDEAALVDTLRQGRIAGAALDTFATEPLPLNSPLRELSNVVLTPHCVGHTTEGAAAIEPALLANIRSILNDQLPPICKNPQADRAWRARLAGLGRVTDVQQGASLDRVS